MSPNCSSPTHKRTYSFDTYGAWGSNDFGVPHHSIYPQTLSLDNNTDMSKDNPNTGYSSPYQNGSTFHRHCDNNAYSSFPHRNVGRDNWVYGPIKFDNYHNRFSRRNPERDLWTQYPIEGDSDQSYSSRRNPERDSWNHHPVDRDIIHGRSSPTRQNRDYDYYYPVTRSWALERQSPRDDTRYSDDGYTHTPMSRWEHESSRDVPWNAVGGVHSGTFRGHGSEYGSAYARGYDGDSAAEGEGYGYGIRFRRSGYTDSRRADVSGASAYDARGRGSWLRSGRRY